MSKNAWMYTALALAAYILYKVYQASKTTTPATVA